LRTASEKGIEVAMRDERGTWAGDSLARGEFKAVTQRSRRVIQGMKSMRGKIQGLREVG